MRRSTVLAFVALLHAAPCLAAEGPAPVLGPDGKPLEVTAQVPNGAGVGLSLAMPGWSQLYLGDKARGYIRSWKRRPEAEAKKQ